MEKGHLFVVSAPSGAGKTTLCKKLTETLPGIKHLVSFTTRKPRPGEVNDRDYSFVSEGDFKRMVEGGAFIEWAVVHGNFYGTSKVSLGETLESGTDVILDIDTKGAKKIKKTPEGEEAVFIFILPPSMDALRERLAGRMSDSKEEMEKRLRRAKDEIRNYGMYNYVIVNDSFDEALGELRAVVSARRAGGEAPKKTEPAWIEKNFLSEVD